MSSAGASTKPRWPDELTCSSACSRASAIPELWDLLWEGVEREAGEHPGARFLRLTSITMVDTHELPGLLPYFMASLYDQATRSIGRKLRAAALDDTRSAPRDPRADLRRVFGLANVVLSDWVAPVLTATGSDYECELAGLMSLQPIYDEDAAADAEDWLGQARRRLSQGGPRQALMHAQRCLRACASLSTLDPPSSAAPLLPAVRLAAGDPGIRGDDRGRRCSG